MQPKHIPGMLSAVLPRQQVVRVLLASFTVCLLGSHTAESEQSILASDLLFKQAVKKTT